MTSADDDINEDGTNMTSTEDDTAASPTNDDTAAPAHRKKWLITGAVLAVVLVIGGALIATQVLDGRKGSATYRFVVPAGTATRVAQGQVIEILPPDLEVRVGDRLIIKNYDSADFIVGPYTVRHGETLEQVFHQPGAITGECGLTRSNEIRIFIT